MTNETMKELFAVVPQSLIAHPDIDATDKLIISYCLGKYQTKLAGGDPWTFSAPSIAKGTGLNERTVRRHLKQIRKQGVLKLYGSRMNGKRKYDIFTFQFTAMESLISSVDKMSVVILNADNGIEAVDKQLRTSTADKLSAKMSDRSKMEEGKKVEGRSINNNQEKSGLMSQLPCRAVAPNINGEYQLTPDIIEELKSKGLTDTQINYYAVKARSELKQERKSSRQIKTGFDSLG